MSAILDQTCPSCQLPRERCECYPGGTFGAPRPVEWTKHSDGYINGNIGVFPYLFKSWEVWKLVHGSWVRVDELKPFDSIDDAKAAAVALSG